MQLSDTEDVSPRSGAMARRIRALAQRVLYPLDRLSFALYSATRARLSEVRPLELPASVHRILILAPHQDDELLGCGGLIARYRGRCEIQVAYVTNGEGRRHRSPEARQALVAERKSEARNVASALGLREPRFLDLPDGGVRGHPRLHAALEELIADLKPQVLLAPFITDSHHDHCATTLGLAQLSPALLDPVHLCFYQVHSHIPDRLLNRFLALSPQEQQLKEQTLRLYISQDMLRDLTLAKYLMFSRVAPQVTRPAGAASIEHFAVMHAPRLRALAQHGELERIVPQLKSISYSPYSFRNYLHNKKLLDTAVARFDV